MIRSKRILIAALLAMFISPAFAQTKSTAAPGKDCYGEWYTLFRERGAKPIPDGSQQIIISVRKEGYAQCFLGKVDVENGKIKFPVLVAKEDGTFESLTASGLKFDPAMMSASEPDALATITDGMSITAYTTDREAVKIFFYKYVNDKPKKNKVAPPVSVLVKN
ncbi:MAG: hypothetical protein OEV74_07700 [Cyclobacteriaceae bacterium]|nr:hypothetical protein [Cyclobacteriaceae bacterium]MDH4296143.1 hypothetical protein [Cyclobacteriaceae bacterium]MDH5248344.1 hypothetical protein [Cyclobacteriaceae bacterium]